ncbi:uncharacterized protein LOC114463077 isoform X2 [Gouania willdenowi]|uniref:Uncharacterized LOC114463077 n=1 Tax=Gouania willdenowi TaxID=441366 RepID=A0A8C5D8V6_GOUWI|nr:uncharacterized protein LOC114463077 isoform X2 [Gouania willdenowi]
MCTKVTSVEVIILSDDEEDDIDLSCQIIEGEDISKKEADLSQSALEQDLVVTFSRRAEVLPHARYDCPIHPFEATESERGAPAGSNMLFCDQCFCYICDKVASSCVTWCHRGECHCNSHKKSKFWNNLRDIRLLGRLKKFNLNLSDLDSHLRLAESMLQSFRQEVCKLFASFLMGKCLQVNGVNQQLIIHDYTNVFQFVSSFLNKADEQESRAAAIMNLGAAEDFILHFSVAGPTLCERTANPIDAKLLLLQRVVNSVQRLMVTADFSSEFINKLQDFYSQMSCPVELKNLNLCVRPWDDVLLVSVLKGQNVTGVRNYKKKRDVLLEQISVVLLRTEVLQRQQRFKELCRYLRVVKTDHSKRFQQLQDLIPFFLCSMGDLSEAMRSLFYQPTPPASRLTPHLFLTYLHIFETATVPKLIVTDPAQLCSPDALTFEPLKGAAPLKRAELVKFTLMAQMNSVSVYNDSNVWTRILTIVNRPSNSLPALPVPTPDFLYKARDVVRTILSNGLNYNTRIPRDFQEEFPDQALLLLVTGALSVRILSKSVCPVIPVLSTFRENLWAINWLYEGLSLYAERFSSFMEEVMREQEMSPDGYQALEACYRVTAFSGSQR